VIGAVANRLGCPAATSKEDVMDEKTARLDEVQRLQNHCDGHSVGTGNPEHTIRLFISRRLEQIEREFAPKPAAAPAAFRATAPASGSQFIAGKPAAKPAAGLGVAATPTKSFVAGK
jgi:hypothetical protein